METPELMTRVEKGRQGSFRHRCTQMHTDSMSFAADFSNRPPEWLGSQGYSKTDRAPR